MQAKVRTQGNSEWFLSSRGNVHFRKQLPGRCCTATVVWKMQMSVIAGGDTFWRDEF